MGLNSSGISPLAIKQDFFAAMFLRNLASMMIFENADVINEFHNCNGNKLEYKANINTVVSILKTDLIEMLAADSKRKRSSLFKNIYFEISRAVVPVRTCIHRKDVRIFEHNFDKYKEKICSNTDVLQEFLTQ